MGYGKNNDDDINDKEDLNNYLMLQQLNGLMQISEELEEEEPISQFQQKKYSFLNRNDKITVVYEGGKVVEDVKFKKT